MISPLEPLSLGWCTYVRNYGLEIGRRLNHMSLHLERAASFIAYVFAQYVIL